MRTRPDDQYPDRIDFICEWYDEFPDMYPEFAPDPVTADCMQDATVIIAFWEDERNGFGLPVAFQFCADHADQWESLNVDDDMGDAVTFVRLDKEVKSDALPA